jgi:hypothetical protein
MASLVGNTQETFPAFEDAEEEDAFKEWKRDLNYSIPEAALVQFLRRNEAWVGACLQEFREYKGDKGQLRRFFARIAHAQVQSNGGSYRPTPRRLDTSGKDSTWIRCDNLFVVVVHKGDEVSVSDAGNNVATFLRDRLLDALREWNPSFLRVMLNYARHRIVEQGFTGDDRVLKDPKSEAGWLMFMESGTPEERRERVTALYGRLFEDLVSEALDQIEVFSAEHVKGFAGQDAAAPAAQSGDDAESAKQLMADVRRRAGVDDAGVTNAKVNDADILHCLNDYLAFEQHTPTFLRTGTVFSRVSLDGKLEGDPAICTTPDCDLVPRMPSSSWGKKLHPHIPVLYRPVAMSKNFTKALASAEQSRALFRKVDSASQVIELLTNGVPRRPEMIFVENSGRIDTTSGEFVGRGVSFNAATTALELQAPQKFRVIGQLRPRYAMRLLHETGHYLSRIGVDFVDWPPQARDK